MKKQLVLFAALMTVFVSNAQANKSADPVKALKVQMANTDVPKPKDDPAMNLARAVTPSCPLAKAPESDITQEAPTVAVSKTANLVAPIESGKSVR